MDPEVAVLMSVFNGQEYLTQTVESVLNQTFENFEFVIVENGSEDSSLSILNSFEDSRIRILPKKENIGLSKALNEGLSHASSDLIARIDADDLMKPQRLDRQVEYMRRNPSVALLGSSIERIFSDGTFRDTVKFPTAHDKILAFFAKGSPFAHPAVIFRKSIVEGLGGYSENLQYAQDFKLWLEIAKRHQTANLDEALTVYRTHAKQNSSKVAKESAMVFEEILGDSHLRDYIDVKEAEKTLLRWRAVPCENETSRMRIGKWKKWSLQLPANSRLALYGGGDHTVRLLDEIARLDNCLRPCVIIDRNPQISHLSGIPLEKPCFLNENAVDYVAISSFFYEKEINGLLAALFPPERILRFYELD